MGSIDSRLHGNGASMPRIARRQVGLAAALSGMLVATSAGAAAPTSSIDMVRQPLLEDRQRDAVLALMKSVDVRMEKAFDGHPGLHARMREQLATIGRIGDARTRAKREAAFREEHATQYGQVLADAGVSAEGLARDLNRIFPAMAFRVDGLHGVVGTRVVAASAPPVAPPPFSEIASLASGFEGHAQRDCGGKGFAQSRFGKRTAVSDGSVSGCRAWVLSMHSGAGAQDALLLSGKLRSGANAYGMFGTSAGLSLAALRNVCARGQSGTDRLELRATIAFAPMGWLADVALVADTVDLQIRNIPPDHACTLATSTHATSLSLLSPATAGSAEVEVTRALAVVEHDN